ncbi:hypothetical protein GEMRC1_006891 [Eukaryota sp. GEM-RC1]
MPWPGKKHPVFDMISPNHEYSEVQYSRGKVHALCDYCYHPLNHFPGRISEHFIPELRGNIKLCLHLDILPDACNRLRTLLKLPRICIPNTPTVASPNTLRLSSTIVPSSSLPLGNSFDPSPSAPDVIEIREPPLKCKQLTVKEAICLKAAEKKAVEEYQDSVCFHIAKLLAARGQPISLADCDELQELLTVTSCGKYKPVCSKTIQTKYLPQVEDHLRKELTDYLEAIKETGCSITTDAWTIVNGTGFMNIVINAPPGPFFFDVIDLTNQKKTGKFIADKLNDVIQHIGVQYVKFVITDNGADFTKAGKILMKEHQKHGLTWLPCAAHTFDLALTNVEGRIPTIKNLVDIAKKIVKFIRNHKTSRDVFNQISEKNYFFQEKPDFILGFYCFNG